MSDQYKFGGLIIAAAPKWLDVTDKVGTENAPFTLAKNDGVGALQFSVGMYIKGVKPNIQISDLQKLSSDFAFSRELGRGFHQQICEQPLLICAQSFASGAQFVRVWYCSNRQDVVLITYVCEKGCEDLELPDCERMVTSLKFESQPTGP